MKINKIYMKNKQIIALAISLTFVANMTFALELKVEERINKALNGVKKEILVENKDSIKINSEKEAKEAKEAKEEKSLKNENKEIQIINKVKVEKELTLKEKFFIKIKEAKTEEERKSILSEFKKELKEDKTERVEKIENKTKNIFNKFDLIIEKLDSVKIAIEKTVTILEEKKINLEFINLKKEELTGHLNLAKTEKALAWIKMQEVDFTAKKENILLDLAEVKKHLSISKDEIKKTSQNSKELIFFVRGVLVSLK